MRVLSWFKDRAVRKVVRYGLPIAIGKFLSAFAGVVTLGLLARHLGPVQFGVIAVMRTVVGLVDQYANFNTWQAVVRYGTEATARERKQDVAQIFKVAVSIDLVTGLLGLLVIAGLAFLIPSSFGWTYHQAALCALYGLTIVTRVAGASDGMFRICDAYRAQAISSTAGAVAMTIAVAIAVAVGAGFDGCVIALIAGEVMSNLFVTLTSFWVVHQAGFAGWLRAPLRGARTRFPGLVRFLLATNGQLTVRKTNSEVDMLIVGAMLGRAPAGFFRVIKQIATIPGRVFLPFEQVLFTELARAIAAVDYRALRRLLRRFAAIVLMGSLLIWAVAAVFARPTVELVAGAEYSAAAGPLRWYLLAMVIGVAATPVQRALIALDRPGTLFLFDLATLPALVGGIVLGAYYADLIGVSIAMLAHRLLQLAWATWIVDRVVREKQTAGAPPAPQLDPSEQGT